MTHLINPPPMLTPPKLPPLFPYLPPFLFLFALHLWLHYRQPAPYMDELFHIPQAQVFCRAFRARELPSYHPDITTLPGLYLAPAVLHTLTFGHLPCSPRVLRLTSLLASLLTLPVLSAIFAALRARTRPSPSTHLTYSLAVWLHPISFFYALLFYTEPPALLALLLAHLHVLTGAHVLAALFAFLATLTRQTNLVWHFYLAADAAAYLLISTHKQKRSLPATIRVLIATFWPHALAGSLYLSFLVLNAGPALGDKAHHSPTAHWAMLPYFFAFHAVSYLPFQLLAPREILAQLSLLSSSRPLRAAAVAVCAVLAGMIIATGDSVHPFALADNRHYVFYIYRKWLLRAAWRRLALVPLCGWGAVSPVLELEWRRRQERTQGATAHARAGMSAFYIAEYVSDALLVLSAAATLLPTPLLEPRYFVVPSTLLIVRRMERREMEFVTFEVICVAAALTLVNVALVYVFAEMPFDRPVDLHMPNDLSPGRFMF